MSNSAVTALEPRRLFASIAGTVFNDLDRSRVLTSNEDPLAGQIVYLDANHNATLDKGETFTTTAENGTYRFSNLPTGTYDVAQVLPKSFIQTSPSSTGSFEGRFDILVRYRTKMTPAQQAAFQIAADRWEAIIIGDLVDHRTDLGMTDDVIIDASVSPIDGVGMVLGQAGPRAFRDPNFLPSRGEMAFDSADLRSLEASGRLNDVITHEMGHVLGIGTIWDKQRRIKASSSLDPRFSGPNTVAQYNAIFKTKALTTPIEPNGGPGTAESHWPEEEFGLELMTGFAGVDNRPILPLSRITVGQMQDLGYVVDYSHADTYDPKNARNNKLWTPADSGVLPFQKRITLDRTDAQNNIDFGIRKNNRPTVSSFTTGTQVLRGSVATLSARAFDRDGDRLIGVTFYRESNGVAGLQPGGDTYIASKLTSKKGLFSVTTATTDLPLGTATFYVSAVDIFKTAGRTAATVQIVSQLTPPARPTNLTATALGDGRVGLNWRDGGDDEGGFRIEISGSSSFGEQDFLRSLNVPANTTATTVDLGSGLFYFRIRSYSDTGRSAYTASNAVTVTSFDA
jgi:hypothetical protein